MPSLRQTALIVVATCIGLAVLGVGAAAVVIWSGVYDVAATAQHPEFVFRIVAAALDQSIAHHSRNIEPPDLTKPDRIAEGMSIYREHCAVCHGEPGIAPRSLATGMTPIPPAILFPARERPAREIFWIVKNGIKMTGMPSWQLRFDDEKLWSIAAFVALLPRVSPARYKSAMRSTDPAQVLLTELDKPVFGGRIANAHDALPTPRNDRGDPGVSPTGAASDPSIEATPPLSLPRPTIRDCVSAFGGCNAGSQLAAGFGSVHRGHVALRLFGCTSCHQIEGVVGRSIRVGPRLQRGNRRGLIAGILPATAANLVKWIRYPQLIKDNTAMPDMGVDETNARDMAAYLLSRN